MSLFRRVSAVLASAVLLASCTPGDGGDVVVTEVVTVTGEAPDPTLPATPAETAPAADPATGAAQVSIPAQLYREVSADPFLNGNGHSLASSDGVTECDVWPAPGMGNGVLDPRMGECYSWSPGRDYESLIVFRQHGDGEFSHDTSPSLPRRWGNDHHRLEPGELVRFGPLTCVSPRHNSLACFDVYGDEGFELADEAYRKLHWDRPVDILTHRDGTREIIGELMRLDFDNGGHIFCDRNGDYINCGGARGLNFPPGSNSVTFVPGQERSHGTGDMGEFQSQAQGAGAGRFLFKGLRVDNDGTRAVFTTAEGKNVWVGVDGFGDGR